MTFFKRLTAGLIALAFAASAAFATSVSVGTPFPWPGNLPHGGAAPATGNGDAHSSSGHYSAEYFMATEDMVVTHIGAKMNAASSPTATFSIQTVSAGLKTGTNFSTNSDTGAVTPSTTFTAYALTGSATIARGDVFALVVTWGAGTYTPGTSGSILSNFTVPYHGTNVGGSDAKSLLSLARNYSLHSSATTFYRLRALRPAASIASNAFNNTNSAARAMKFTIPFNARVVGIRTYQGTATGNYVAALANSDCSSVLSTSDTTITAANSAAVAGTSDIMFDNAVSVTNGTSYCAYLEPNSATNINFYTATMPTSGATASQYRGAWPGGTAVFASSRSSGTWTDATDQVPFMDILIDEVDAGDGTSTAGRRMGPGLGGR